MGCISNQTAKKTSQLLQHEYSSKYQCFSLVSDDTVRCGH